MGATSAAGVGAAYRRRRRARLEPPSERQERQRRDAGGMGLGTLVTAIVEGLRVTLRLATDPRVPFLDRAAAGAALLYLVSPIDLISDLLPVVGQLDDLALVVWAWRRLLSGAGADIVSDRWNGDRRALDVVLRFAGLR